MSKENDPVELYSADEESESSKIPQSKATTKVTREDKQPAPPNVAPARACFNCWKLDHQRKDCKTPPLNVLHCFWCGQKDVTVASCSYCSSHYKKIADIIKSNDLGSLRRDNKVKFCRWCGQENVSIPRDCSNCSSHYQKISELRNSALKFVKNETNGKPARGKRGGRLNRLRLGLRQLLQETTKKNAQKRIDESPTKNTEERVDQSPSNDVESAKKKQKLRDEVVTENKQKFCDKKAADVENEQFSEDVKLSKSFLEESFYSFDGITVGSGDPVQDFVTLIESIQHLSVPVQETVIMQVIKERQQLFKKQN